MTLPLRTQTRPRSTVVSPIGSLICKRRREALLHRKIARDEVGAVISQLLEDGKARLTTKDLTHAVANNSIGVLRAHAESVDSELDSDHLMLAVERNSFAVLRWAVQRKAAHHVATEWEGEEEWLEAFRHMPLLAARLGYTGMPEWMLSGECKELFDEGFPDHCLCEEAASCGNWNTLLFLIEHGAKGMRFADCRKTVSRLVDEHSLRLERSLMLLESRSMRRVREEIRTALEAYDS
ncbi:hypothetical protein CYMTET_41726 [Cymbomonas tetramitiformis]|uniref:Uncharacterized protein n=1 Tax=Cymbomonas tetramitiformis TaxID=36881 RepID=A0AAE0C5H4_9CHLO|nr:hypothetical protein CYMTET_41726 [Cymbomonas tetramitiformis]